MSNTKHLADLLKVCSILPALAIMPAMGAMHTEDIIAEAGTVEKISTGAEEVYTGSLSGSGNVYIVPKVVPNTNNSKFDSTKVVWEGSIKDFTGGFLTTVSGSKQKGTGILVLKNWEDGQHVNLLTAKGDGTGNFGTVIFDGKGKVKITAFRQVGTGNGMGSIYLMGNELDNTSDVDQFLYLGGNGVDEQGRNVSLKGYKNMSGATLFAGGRSNVVNGNVITSISDSNFGKIYGNGNDTDVNGRVVLDVEDLIAETIIGNNAAEKSFVTGDVIVDVSDSNITNVQGFNVGGEATAGKIGLGGNILVDVEDSVIKDAVRGLNISSSLDSLWAKENLAPNTKNIVINVEDTVVGTEIIGLGSKVSTSGDITINLKGVNAVGYTDLAATTESDAKLEDITVRVGAKRADTEVAGNTTLNIDTSGGNKVVVNGILNPGNEASAGYVLGNAVLNMTNSGKGYGEINAKTIETFNIKGTAAINLSNVHVNVEKIAAAFDEINIGERGVLTVGELNLKEGSVLSITLAGARNYGGLKVTDSVVGADKTSLELLLSSAGEYKDVLSGEIDFEDFASVSAGAVFDIEQQDNVLIVKTKSVADIAKATGVSTQAAGAVASLANANSGKAHQVFLALQEALGTDGGVAYVERETKKLNPTDKPVAQAAAASVQNQVLSLASGRMAGGVSVGRAGGDEMSQENGFWIQGLFNKSKFGDQFHGYTRGVALGADTLIDKKWTVGAGLAFNNSDVHADSGRTDIDSKTLFLYGQYKPNNWFVNATATYSMSEYTENKTVTGVSGLVDSYDVDAYGVQMMGGYDFATGITTEAGLRYLHIAQDDYVDARDAQIMATDTDFLTGVAGLKYAFAIENDWAIQLRPELRAAMTYDFISDEATATVVMPGVASYKVDAERLSRLGGEFGIGLTALYKGMEVSLMYDLDLHRDYTSQTGMIKFRGKF